MITKCIRTYDGLPTFVRCLVFYSPDIGLFNVNLYIYLWDTPLIISKFFDFSDFSCLIITHLRSYSDLSKKDLVSSSRLVDNNKLETNKFVCLSIW